MNKTEDLVKCACLSCQEELKKQANSNSPSLAGLAFPVLFGNKGIIIENKGQRITKIIRDGDGAWDIFKMSLDEWEWEDSIGADTALHKIEKASKCYLES